MLRYTWVAMLRACRTLLKPADPPTMLPGRWRNVGKGCVDSAVSDPAYVPPPPKKTHVRDDIVRLITNQTL